MYTLYIYIHIHVYYICTTLSVCLYVCLHGCMHVCNHACMHVCMCYIYIYVCVCLYVCMYACMYVMSCRIMSCRIMSCHCMSCVSCTYNINMLQKLALDCVLWMHFALPSLFKRGERLSSLEGITLLAGCGALERLLWGQRATCDKQQVVYESRANGLTCLLGQAGCRNLWHCYLGSRGNACRFQCW